MGDRPAEGCQRRFEFLLAALEEGRPLRDGWRDSIHDALMDIDKILRRNDRLRQAHYAWSPDDVDGARSAIGSLAGIFLDEDENEALYLGGEQP